MSHLRNEKICTFCHTQQVITYIKKPVLRFYACTCIFISVAAWLTWFDFFGETCFCNYEECMEFIWNDPIISTISCWVYITTKLLLISNSLQKMYSLKSFSLKNIYWNVIPILEYLFNFSIYPYLELFMLAKKTDIT